MTDIKQAIFPEEPQAGPESPQFKRILVVFAHPDDPEFSVAGSIARWVSEGHQATYCLVTSGDKGFEDRSLTLEQAQEIRETEQRAACAVLGVSDVIFLRVPDGMVEPTIELRRDLTRVIRQVKPDVVMTGDPTSWFYDQSYLNHPDHRAVPQAMLSALFPAAGNARYFPELLDEGLEPHTVKELYVTMTSNPDTWIDISDFMDKKIASLQAHKSQLANFEFEPMIREWAAKAGEEHDPPVQYAEGFRYLNFEDGP